MAVSAVILILTALFVYGAVILWFGFNQRSVLFIPDHARYTPMDFDIKGGREVTAESGPGVKLTGWYWPPVSPDKKTVVYFHGNGNGISIALHARVMEAFTGAGYGFLFATYRGFNGNAGVPTETGLYEDARAWMKTLDVPAEQVVLYGMSLGTGVAVKMAQENPDVSGVILEAPYTSFAALVRGNYPYVRFDWALRHRFDSLSRIGDISKPVLVLQGEKDRIVPAAQARTLCAAAVDCTLRIYPDGGHDDLYKFGIGREAVEFIGRALGSAPA